MNSNQFNSLELDALKEVSNIGVGNAATALSTLLETKIDISVPAVNMINLNELIELSGEKIVVAVIVRVVGDIPGNILILFSGNVAEEVIAHLLGRHEEVITEIGASVLCEVGNILSGAYMNSIAKFTGLNVFPSVPAIACDMMSAILATTFMESGQYDEKILDIETVFIRENNKDRLQEIGAHFYYIPAPGSLEKILKSIGI